MTSKSIDTGRVSGSINVPASKSLTHRYFIQSALSCKPTIVRLPLQSEDTKITLNALRSMGYEFEDYGESVAFTGNKLPVDNCSFWVENSGTSARLLSGVMSLQPFVCKMDGSERMRQRPMRTLIDALTALGATVGHNDGYLPLEISGGQLRGGELHVDATKSSQFLSSLLLIAPYLTSDLILKYGETVASESYLLMTVELMRRAGVEVELIQGGFRVPAGQNYSLTDLTVEGDFSSAAYFLTAAALTGGRVTIENVTPNSLQGDSVIVEVLEKAGADVQWGEKGITVKGRDRILPVDVDVQSVPDLAPTIAVLALFADGPSTLRHVEHLKYKECDRLAGVIENIQRLGGKAYTNGDSLIIEPAPLQGTLLASWNDHRMSMCFSLVGLRVPNVVIENRECVVKSYPNYWQDLESLLEPA